jgi:DNA-binding transcriptional LysR family regulator
VPKWLTKLEEDFAPIRSRLMALNVHDAVLQLVEGGCDLLLCYHHPRQPVQLDPGRYDMLVLGHESLRAYARCDKNKVPEFSLPGTSAAPLPFLSYTNNAYLGRMVELILSDAKTPLHLEPHYETDMAEGLKMMALEGRGVAFLPESAVTRVKTNSWRAPTAAPRTGKSKWKSACTASALGAPARQAHRRTAVGIPRIAAETQRPKTPRSGIGEITMHFLHSRMRIQHWPLRRLRPMIRPT